MIELFASFHENNSYTSRFRTDDTQVQLSVRSDPAVLAAYPSESGLLRPSSMAKMKHGFSVAKGDTEMYKAHKLNVYLNSSREYPRKDHAGASKICQSRSTLLTTIPNHPQDGHAEDEPEFLVADKVSRIRLTFSAPWIVAVSQIDEGPCGCKP